MNANERLITRIDAVQDDLHRGRYASDDADVLNFIRNELRPASIKRRSEAVGSTADVTHLHEVASMRLKPYERAPLRIQSEEDDTQ